MKKKTRSCPLCLSNKDKVIFTQKFTGHFFHQIAVCQECGFVFVDNTPSQATYLRYYSQMSKYEGVRIHESHFDDTSAFIRQFIRQNIKKIDKVLDVGCSTGELLAVLKDDGCRNLDGLDPAPGCRKIAWNKYGLHIKTADLEHFASKRKYPFIILSQVLEHFVDLKKSIKKITSLLIEDGYVFIGVPDAGNFFQNFEEPFGEFGTEHINFFSQFSLYRLMQNYRCICMESRNNILLSVWRKGSQEEKSIREYIKHSQNKLDGIKKTINTLPNKIIVWGAGALTQRLLKTTNLKKKVLRIVDLNQHLIGNKLDGLKIISSEELYSYNNPILISSFRFREEILNYISTKYPNKIITL